MHARWAGACILLLLPVLDTNQECGVKLDSDFNCDIASGCRLVWAVQLQSKSESNHVIRLVICVRFSFFRKKWSNNIRIGRMPNLGNYKTWAGGQLILEQR